MVSSWSRASRGSISKPSLYGKVTKGKRGIWTRLPSNGEPAGAVSVPRRLGPCRGVLNEMGLKEKEHEIYFLDQVRDSRCLPFFEWLFSWGARASANDVDLQSPRLLGESHQYCKARTEGDRNVRGD
jgi:hypothetical protein